MGVDTIQYAYFRAKRAVERMIEDSGRPWTILRTTQFHDLVLTMLSMLARPPVAVVPRGMRVQPVDTGEVADRVDLAPGGAGRASAGHGAARAPNASRT